TKEVDLVKAAFTPSIAQANGYFYFELRTGAVAFSVGFPDLQLARQWMSAMMEAAGKHPIWLQFELFAEILAEIFFSSVQQRDPEGLARLESFERAASDFALSSGNEQWSVASAAGLPSSSSTSSLSSGVPSFTSPGVTSVSSRQSTRREDVDELKLAGIRLEFASKSWQGHKRLEKETSRLAKFRSLIELFVSESKVNGESSAAMRTVLSKLPSFPLIAAFSIRGVRVVATAEPLRSERSTLLAMDSRDLMGLVKALKEAKMLRYFPYQELPELVVRKLPGNSEPTLTKVHPRFDDVLLNSLRSSMVHGVLLRAGYGESRVELLSALDMKELLHNREPHWIPYLDLVYYQLETRSSMGNQAANAFLLKAGGRTLSQPLTGDIVISVDPEKSKLALDLPEGFVLKHKVELHPLVYRLEEVKKNRSIFALAASTATFAQSHNGKSRPVEDAGLLVAREYEDGVKKLFVQHIKEFAAQLVTLGDAPETKRAAFASAGRSRAPTWARSPNSAPHQRLGRSNTMTTMPRREDVFASASSLQRVESEQTLRPPMRRRMSSLASVAQALGTGGLADSNTGTYVIDTLHLRQVMREGGVNMRFLPLVFHYLHPRSQQGVRMLVASEIVARLAKNLFRYRMLNEETGGTSRWKARKPRLIRLIDSIMHGLFHQNLFQDGQCRIKECSGDQFWDVDAPIVYALGVFSSAFALDSQVQERSLRQYRDLLKVNPGILFSSLQHVFQARLTTSILPELHENRFISVPFLRNEGDLTFNNEEDDPKLSLRLHPALLWSNLQFFRLQFEVLKPAPPALNAAIEQSKDKRGKLGVRTELTTWTKYYRILSQLFRQSLSLPQSTRLEKAIQSWQDVTTVRAHLSLALRAAAAPSSLPSSGGSAAAVIQEHCRVASDCMAGSKALFPVEFKLALRCLELISSGEELASILENNEELLDWLRFFYRPANPSQFVKGSSSHPVFSLQYSKREDVRDPSQTPESSGFSLRSRFQRKQLRDSWVTVMSNVDAYCRRIEEMRRDPVDVAATRAVLCELGGTLSRDASTSLSPTSSLDSGDSSVASVDSEVSWSDKYQAPLGFRAEEPSSAMYSSKGDALWFIECFFLPPLATNSLLVAGDALMANDDIARRLTDSSGMGDGPVPGLALTWGKPMGLSLDEEAHISGGSRSATSSLRPTKETANLVSLLAFPAPLRRVVQVACGYRHTALVTDDRHLHTFGYGECGRLGHGTEESCMEPTAVGYFVSLIETEGLDVGGVVAVACGREHTMAVTANGELFGFGWGEAGRLGTGETGSSLFPSRVTALKAVKAVACGREHTLALTKGGQVFAFGAGFGGRLGNGSERDEELPALVGGLESVVIAAVDAGECHSCALSDQGDVFTWGFGSSGALGHGDRDNRLVPQRLAGPWTRQQGEDLEIDAAVVTAVACGSYHTLACLSDGVLYGWGDAAAGQLGIEHVAVKDLVVLSPQQIRVPTSSQLRGIACGTFVSAACTQDGRVFLWGSPAAGNGAPLQTEDARVQRIGVLGEFELAQIACGTWEGASSLSLLA
ncbi:hypothetical protein BBJ28_00002836, partial [Nothophytophthora sp. Chile5]